MADSASIFKSFHETGALPVNENPRIPSQLPGTYHLPQIHISLIYSADQMISNQQVPGSDLVFSIYFHIRLNDAGPSSAWRSFSSNAEARVFDRFSSKKIFQPTGRLPLKHNAGNRCTG
jgi:hypothetical protein